MIFIVRNQADRERMWRQLCAMDMPFEVSTQPWREDAANEPQRALYRAWVALIADETGEDWSYADRSLRRAHLPVALNPVNGRLVERLTDLSSLNRADMTRFLTRVQAEAAELGINLPTGDDQ